MLQRAMVLQVYDLKQSGGAAAWCPAERDCRAGCLVSSALAERTCFKSYTKKSTTSRFLPPALPDFNRLERIDEHDDIQGEIIADPEADK